MCGERLILQGERKREDGGNLININVITFILLDIL